MRCEITSCLALAFGCSSGGERMSAAGGSLGGLGTDATDASSDGDSVESTAATGASTSGGESDTMMAPDAGPRFDVGASPDAGAMDCGQDGGGAVHSHIWIANSLQGTVSKINTRTMIEEGRYIVHPGSNGDPSRTSVSLSGDVAVANRRGGVTKVFDNINDCAFALKEETPA